MKLDAKDRIVIQGLLPSRGNILKLQIIKEISGKIELNPKERETVKMRAEGEMVYWEDGAASGLIKDVDLTKPELELLNEAVTRMEKEESITMVQLPTILKIREEAKAEK